MLTRNIYSSIYITIKMVTIVKLLFDVDNIEGRWMCAVM